MTIKEQRWKKALSRNYCDVDDETFSSLLNHLSHIFEEQAHKQEGHSEAIRAHLDLFFISYIRQLRNPVSAANPGKDYVRERYEEFAGLLETNITSMKNVSQYAGLMNISSYQLNSITKATVGKTVSALIDEQVILESKRYLLATPNQVKEIADHLGYEDPSYFIRFFKKHTGYSPDTFRKSFK